MENLIIGIVTLGCKVNQCESATIAAALRRLNYDASEGLKPADVYILNTCSVTAEADRKSRQYISKMQKLNPQCHIIVIGCSSQNNPSRFNKENVIAVGGTANKTETVINAVENLAKGHYNTLSDIILFDNSCSKTDNICCGTSFSDKTRTFIKIQDGCNRFCTYCIIPYLRGRSRSAKIEDVVKECETSDSKEIVLTGIDISMYGRDIDCTLSDLLAALSHIKARKRLGSLECEIIDEKLLEVMLEGNYCPHFHLSLQSGSNTVLKTMNRRYDTVFFKSKVDLIRKYFPSAGITTDIIVGFPTEGETEFIESLKFIEACGFSDIHIFPYSSRTGTLASRKYAMLPKNTVHERELGLAELKNKLRTQFLRDNIGSVQPVYVEDAEDGFNVGYTPNYIKVYSDAPCGSISNLRLVDLHGDGILGVL